MKEETFNDLIMFLDTVTTDTRQFTACESTSKLEQTKALFVELTPEERMEVLGDYCKKCGNSDDDGCLCYID